jgi:hypothetical protein
MDLVTGSRNRVPVARSSAGPLERAAARTRSSSAPERELEGSRGSSRAARRPIGSCVIYNSNRDIVEVARAIAEATEALPTAV